MQQQFVHNGGESNRGITIQLTGSYLLVGTSDLTLMHWLVTRNTAPVLIVVMILICSIGIGLLTTANIQFRLFALHLTLTRVAEGQKVELTRTTFWYWPLRPLFRSLASVIQREDLAHGYHAQLLQQTSEAAALEERNRLARDLHDSIKQQLFSIRMSAIAARAHMQRNQAGAQTAIDDIQKSANEAQVEMQALLQQLRSVALEHTTLMEAVQTQALALEYRSGVQTEVNITGLPSTECCPPAMQEAIFRIIQEGLANIARHARAYHVQCTIEANEKNLLVMIRDDGQGFNPQDVQTGMGLANIQERARFLNGTAQIESEVGKGTTIHVQVPLLLPLEVKQQDEQQEAVIQKTIEHVHRGLQIRSTLATFAMVLLVIDLALFATSAQTQTKGLSELLLGACFLFMCYGLVSAHLAIVRLRLYYDENELKMRAFHFHERSGWIHFTRLLIIALWHCMLWGLVLAGSVAWWQIGIYFFAFILVLLVAYIYMYWTFERAQNRFYSLLSPNALKAEIRQRRTSLRWRIIIFLALGAPLIIQNVLFKLLTNPFWHWLGYYILFMSLIMCLGIAMDSRHVLHWQARLSTKNQFAKDKSYE